MSLQLLVILSMSNFWLGDNLLHDAQPDYSPNITFDDTNLDYITPVTLPSLNLTHNDRNLQGNDSPSPSYSFPDNLNNSWGAQLSQSMIDSQHDKDESPTPTSVNVFPFIDDNRIAVEIESFKTWFAHLTKPQKDLLRVELRWYILQQRTSLE